VLKILTTKPLQGVFGLPAMQGLTGRHDDPLNHLKVLREWICMGLVG
jgi:hypothetical protein